MYKKFFLSIFYLFTIFISISCFAESTDLNSSIARIEGHKVYLKTGTIQIAKNGIFINVAGQLKPINHLEMDEKGVYFDINKQPSFGESCPICRFPLVFGLCLNPSCPSKE